MSGTRLVSVGAAGAACVAGLAGLAFDWATAGDSGARFFTLISQSSALSVTLCLAYLLFTPVTLGLAAASWFGPPRATRYARGAVLAALGGLAAIGGVGYRILAADLDPGLGWYLSAGAGLATVVAAVAAAINARRAAQTPHIGGHVPTPDR